MSNVEGALTTLYTALTILLVSPEDPSSQRMAAEALRETRPLLLNIMHKAGF